MNQSPIPWRLDEHGDQGMTWNPVTGCTFGCPWCYARRMARRVHLMRGGTDPAGAETLAQSTLGGDAFVAQPDDVYPWAFYPTVYPHRIDQPIKRKKPADIFLGSMADIFDPAFPDEFRDRIFATIAATPRHRYIVLTKRADEMHRYFCGGTVPRWVFIEGAAQAQHERLTGEDPSEWLSVKLPLPNLMFGVTVTNQAEADERVPLLLDTPAAYRMVSVEPMLGAVSLADSGHDWLAGWEAQQVGGYSYVTHDMALDACEPDLEGQCCGEPTWEQVQTPGIDFVAIGAKTPGKALHERSAAELLPHEDRSMWWKPSECLSELISQCVAAGVSVHYKHGNKTPEVDGTVYDATIAQVMK